MRTFVVGVVLSVVAGVVPVAAVAVEPVAEGEIEARVTAAAVEPATGDGTALPVVTLDVPESGTVVWGAETLTATVDADAAVATVTFVVDGLAIETSTAVPYQARWDTTTVADGDHEVVAVAVDARGQVGRSDPVVIAVDQGAGAAERLEEDLRAGVVTPADFAMIGLRQALDPAAVEVDRYRPSRPAADPTAAALSALRGFDELARADQDGLRAYLTAETVTVEPPGALRAAATMRTTAVSAGPCSTGQAWRFPGSLLLPCRHETAHAVFYYQLEADAPAYGVPADDVWDHQLHEAADGGGPNGIPDYIDAAAASLEAAYGTYVGLGYREPSERLAVSDRLEVAVTGGRSGFASPINELLFLGRDASPIYLPRHELFHHFQYNYAPLGALASDHFGGPSSTTGWWLEATAEWAAHQATLDAPVGRLRTVNSTTYAQRLPDFLRRPSDALTSFESPFGGSPRLPQYGAFLFPEYLDERFGRDVVRQTWEAIDAAIPRRAIDALDVVLEQEYQADLRLVTADFHIANYTMDYQDGDRDVWLQTLEDSGISELLGDPRNAQARPGRDHRIVADSGRTARGSVADLQPGGVAYVDLTLPTDDRGRMVVQVGTSAWGPDAAVLDARVITWSAFPTRCNQQALPLEMGQGTGAVAVGLDNSGPCQFATLLISHTDPTARDSHPVSYTARFAAFTPDETVEIGTGAVSTVAGSARAENVDGVGDQAGFAPTGGMVVVDGVGYVHSWGAIRKVDLATGEVSTLVETPCPGAHRGTMATDGYYLFSVPCSGNGSRLLRTTLSTGATVDMGSGYNLHALTTGPDGALYYSNSYNGSITLRRIDPDRGVDTAFAALPASGWIAADRDGFWIGAGKDLWRLDFGTKEVTKVATTSIGLARLASAGDYLYAIDSGQRVVRVAKVDGAVAAVAGGPNGIGHADGVGTDAGFTNIGWLASDGADLYATDGSRVRRITDAPGEP